MAVTIDLNADLAEDCGDDSAMYPLLSSANICCGQHAGGGIQMRVAVRAALRNTVVIGAHVGYPDRTNFGRLDRDYEYPQLYDVVMRQLRDLQYYVDMEGGQTRYVKPHGALYHAVGRDEEQARALVDAVSDFNPGLDLMVPDTPVITTAASLRFLRTVHEFFADRAYLPEGTLAPRGQEGAVLDDPDQVAGRVLEWLETGEVVATDGQRIAVRAQSVCVHGDTPGALATTRAIRAAMAAAGHAVASWLA